MPKQVDHDARRQEIGAAVCRVMAARGLDAVSLRHVAAEAGVSMGRVQHYFATKDEMLLFAFRLISDRVAQRIGAIHSDDPRAFLRALLLELLPLNEAARTEAPVLVAFVAQAVVEPRLARTLAEGGREMVAFVASLLRRANPHNDDADRDAMALLAFADGLMLQVLIGQVEPEVAESLVDHQIERVLTTARYPAP